MALIQNAIHIRETDFYLVSTYVHDYKEYAFKDGPIVAVEGGREYARRAGDCLNVEINFLEGHYEEVCLNETDPFSWIADRLLWGTRGKDGTLPYTHRPIKEFTLEHLTAILALKDVAPMHRRVAEHWLAEKSKA